MMFCRSIIAFSVAMLAACATPRSGPPGNDQACARIQNLPVVDGGTQYADPAEAIKVLSECDANSKNTPILVRATVLRMRSIAYAQTKDYAKAIADSEEVFRLQPARTAWDVIELASFYRDAGQADQALVLLRKMFDENLGTRGRGTTPGMPSYYHLGLTLLALEKWPEAAEAFTEGLTYQSDYVWAYFYRAVAYDGMHDAEHTRADLKQGKKLVEALSADSRAQIEKSLKQAPFASLLAKYAG